MQENRILTPILFTLLLLIVFFVWVNVIVAIISEVYTQEVERSLFVEWDPDFASMALDAPQPENDVAAMVPHQPVHTVAGQAAPAIVALTPFRCAAGSTAKRSSSSPTARCLMHRTEWLP